MAPDCASRRRRFRFGARLGLTLIELLVAVAIIGILTALTLSAVQAARHAAWGVECRSRLHQIGVALHAYEGANGCFPGVCPPSFRLPGGAIAAIDFWSMHSRILPMISQASTYDSLNFSIPPYLAESLASNRTAARTTIAAFLCPADPFSPRGSGRVSYRASTGPSPRVSPWFPVSARGAFSPLQFVRAAEIADGLANTVFVTERMIGNGDVASPDAANVGYGGELEAAEPPIDPDLQIDLCSRSAAGRYFADSGESWLYSGLLSSTVNEVAPPNHPSCDCLPGAVGIDMLAARAMASGMVGARSHHRGGVQVLFGDGSVTFVSDSVDRFVWRALGTRAGGENASLQ